MKRIKRIGKKMRSLKASRFNKVAHPWGIADVWNKSFEEVEKREVKKRDYLWATDMSRSLVDVYLSMKGVKPSNPPNARSMRKFEAGDVFEWIVKMLLIRAGLLKSVQLRTTYQYKDFLPMVARLDFVAGGKPDLREMQSSSDFLNIPPVFRRGVTKIITHINRQYKNGLPEMPFEVKSISSFIADGMEKKNRSIKHHRTQVLQQLLGSRYEKGMLIYICRDDLRMFEFCIEKNDKAIRKEHKNFISDISYHWKKEKQPEIEDPIVFDEDMGKFSKNFKVEYSQYLKKLYGFKEPRRYSEFVSPRVQKWNRVLGRVKNGDKMTDKNKEAIQEMKDEGFNFKKIIKQFANGGTEE